MENGQRLASLDLTQRKLAEEKDRILQSQLSQAAKLTAIGEVTAGVAHELNNPLTAVRGYAEEILLAVDSETVDRKDLKECTRKILHASDRMEKIIRQLRKFSRQQGFEPVLCNIRQIVDDAFILLEKQLMAYRIKIIRDDLAPEVHVWCDPNQIEQIIVNILCNAKNALSESKNAQIRISTSRDEHGGTRVTIWNNGEPIPESIHAQIFEPFFTTRSVGDGTGLGLFLSRNIMKRHGGDVTFVSSAQQGTAFTLTFPDAAAVPETNTPPLKTTIMIVDDESILRDLLVRRLKRMGCDVVEATNGEEALKLVEQGGVAGLFCDIRMPGMDGLTFVARVKNKWPSLPIVLMSGSPGTHILDCDIKKLGVVGFMPKPVDPDVFSELLNKMLRRISPNEAEIVHDTGVRKLTS